MEEFDERVHLLPELWAQIIGWLGNNPGARGKCQQVCRAWYKADLEVNLPLHKGLVEPMCQPYKLSDNERRRLFCALHHLRALPPGYVVKHVEIAPEWFITMRVVSPDAEFLTEIQISLVFVFGVLTPLGVLRNEKQQNVAVFETWTECAARLKQAVADFCASPRGSARDLLPVSFRVLGHDE